MIPPQFRLIWLYGTAVAVSPVGAATVPVSLKVAGALAPETLAVTARVPTALGSAVTCAWPRELVDTVFPAGKLTPVPTKVTDALGTRLPNASCTMTVSGLVNSALYTAVWPEPPISAMLAAGPTGVETLAWLEGSEVNNAWSLASTR